MDARKLSKLRKVLAAFLDAVVGTLGNFVSFSASMDGSLSDFSISKIS